MDQEVSRNSSSCRLGGHFILGLLGGLIILGRGGCCIFGLCKYTAWSVSRALQTLLGAPLILVSYNRLMPPKTDERPDC